MTKCKVCGSHGYGWHDCFNVVLHEGGGYDLTTDWKRKLEELYKDQIRRNSKLDDELAEYKRKFDQLCAIFHLAMEQP